MRRPRGFTLTELAIVLAIVAILLSSVMYTLSAQSEARGREESLRRLDQAKELLLSYAIVNGRLPCPARCSNWPACTTPGDSGDESPAGGGACTEGFAGYLPGRTIGFLPTDGSGYALDAWGNRIRYSVSLNVTGGIGAINHFTTALSLKQNGVATMPNDLLVCASSLAAGFSAAGPDCGTNANRVTNVNTVAAVIWSHGKNYTSMPAGNVDEQINNKHRLPAPLNNNAAFVWHDIRPVGAVGGEYDDLLLWIPVGQFYGRLISAGVLP